MEYISDNCGYALKDDDSLMYKVSEESVALVVFLIEYVESFVNVELVSYAKMFLECVQYILPMYT